MPAFAATCVASGKSITLTPAHRAVAHSQCCRARSAEWLAQRAAEHAVSIDMHGPWRPKTNEMRPQATAMFEPVAA
eukprot:scaffold104841_cov29-Tisochrysis_lutea.AAC.3